ncbi:hydantoinase B/oxoprolinase family protein [Conexibacter sp. CPCC 206217]|uniref:hydantoinase B/oxoprolinase family protein n=1 Tax=Conexibacter sp. CPCC 206217 TaxID=3064574 RepID=UPI002718BF84|nr:hydantoinase B/oxoprolinase family protein [Conexibacter sp. CPCC 206217]MDO8210168.1 hydantoinase B/oxoprolinase family protein [Conexibacter sp. CPCC 206217]
MSDDLEQQLIDPVTLSVVQGALQATQRAMTLTMERTGRSPVYSVARDYSNAIFDWDARMVLQGEDLPTHLGSLVLATKAVAGWFGDDVAPGDVMFHNDPVYDGSHIADMCMYKPVFFEGEVVFWAVSKGHVIDAGGPVPGSYNAEAKEIWAEGLRIPPLKIVERGRRREDVINMILLNVRSRRNQAGDMNAQMGAVRLGEQRLLALLEKFGVATVRAAIERLLELAEEHTRTIVRALPDGVYRNAVISEDPGHGHGDQTIAAEVEIRGDRATVRISGPPQIDFYMNSYRSNTLSGIYAGFLMFAQVQPPFNEGLYRPLEVDFGPPGTMVNAVEPAPHVNCTGGMQETICDAVRGAFTQARPERALAGWNHTCGMNIAGVDPRSGESYVDLRMSTVIGGAGALAGVADGWHAIGAQAALGAQQTGETELVEHISPVIIHELSIAQDSAGPGTFRGGCGLVTEFEPIGHDMSVIVWGEGFAHRPPSVDGAFAVLPDAKLARGWHIVEDEAVDEVRTNRTLVVRPGERFRFRNPGGGGAGDPFARPPELVAEDVRNRKVSAAAARTEYGVAIDPASGEPDLAATIALRALAAAPSDASEEAAR